jgi:hypothetical protein
LLASYKLCDAEIQGNASIFADYRIDENYISNKLKARIAEDKQILHPKTQTLPENPQKFIHDIL